MTTPLIYPQRSMPVIPDDDTARDGGWQRHPPQIRLALPSAEDVAALVAEVNAAEPEKQRRAHERDREVRMGQTVCAVITIVALIVIALWIGPNWLLP